MDLSKSGMSDREVANFLNNNSVTLPDGMDVNFRPRGKRGDNLKNPRRFTRESIRAILENPFYSGQVARYHRPMFNMEDDLEQPENIPAPKIEGNSREILDLHKGQYEPLFSFETWSAIQSLRKQRSTTPTMSNKTVRIYPLSGIGRCWECFEEIGQEFSLRGSPGGKGFMYYRCAYTHDQALKRKPKIQPRLEGINPVVQTIDRNLAKRHKSLRAEKLEAQVNALVSKLFLPREWEDWIVAFYLSEDGMAEFERAGYGYRQELKNLQKLFEAEQVSRPEFERRVRTLHHKLKSLRPASNLDASEMLDENRSFGNIWTQLDNGEKRIFLSRIFDSLFFDREGRLVRVVAFEPFRRILNLPEDGMIVEM